MRWSTVFSGNNTYLFICLFFPKEKSTRWTLVLPHSSWLGKKAWLLNSEATTKSEVSLSTVSTEVSPSPVPSHVPSEKTGQGLPHGQLTLRRLLVDQVVARREAILSHCHVRVKGQGEDPCGRAEFRGGFGPAVLANQRAN